MPDRGTNSRLHGHLPDTLTAVADLRCWSSHNDAKALRKSLWIAFSLLREEVKFFADHLSEGGTLLGWHKVGSCVYALRPSLKKFMRCVLRFLPGAVRVSVDVILLE